MIVISGTPGTGKTQVARLVAKSLGLPLLDVTRLVREERLFTSRENGVLVVDMPALGKRLRGFSGLAEGHVLCELKLPARCVVLRTDPRVLEARLKRRKYRKQKILDNVESEALDYCLIYARENYRDVLQVDTTRRTAEQTARRVLRVLDGKAVSDKVDWTDWILNH
ncbi:MAG: adenylate kinase family protein [Candidatus Diapherotrites archaeon]|nr:adenylate kinase family protein [Candidatus Diapherotrites archaeon]